MLQLQHHSFLLINWKIAEIFIIFHKASKPTELYAKLIAFFDYSLLERLHHSLPVAR